MELSEADKKRVWDRGQHSPTAGIHQDYWGARIVWEQYGTEEEFEWRGEPYVKRKDRPETLEDLEPFHWKNVWERHVAGRALKKITWSGKENCPVSR